MTLNNEGSSPSLFSQKVSHQYFTSRMGLRRKNIIFSLFEKLWTEKYSSTRFNHLSATSVSIRPSNMGISMLIYTLKGAAPMFEEYASFDGNHQRISAKLSIIPFLLFSGTSSSNIFKGHLVLSSFISPTMRGLSGVWDIFSSREASSTPNSLYPDLVGDTH